jgi:hypothetical protein
MPELGGNDDGRSNTPAAVDSFDSYLDRYKN